MRHDCGAETQERRLAKIEADWLAAPEDAELLEVYTCGLCGSPIFEGEEYQRVSGGIERQGFCFGGFGAKNRRSRSEREITGR